jgi:predicted kinase
MVVLVFGLPGSGKSYFSERLANTLGAQYISSDKIRRKMNLKGKYTFEDKFSVYQEMAKITGLAIEQGKDVVVDGTFYHKRMRELVIVPVKAYQTPLHFIEITAPEEIAKERLRKPREESEADYSVYHHVKKKFDRLGFSPS